MKTSKAAPKDIDAYIAIYPRDVQEVLQKVRATIRKAAPEAEEAISYQMPTFKLGGNLVHFAAFKEHIGFYPTPSGITKFAKQLAPYAGGKGSLRFPLDKPMPYDLIAQVVKFRVAEQLASQKAKGNGRVKSAAGQVKPASATSKGAENEVDRFLANLRHPRKADIETVRAVILGADKRISEHVKWNAPSFVLQDDFATMKLQPANTVQVVLHRGAKRKAGAITVADPKGLLKWAAKDRAVVTFADAKDIQGKKAAFTAILKQWIKQL